MVRVLAMWRRFEGPTWILAAAILGGWCLLTWWHARLSWWQVLPLGAWLIAWQMSLQHELIHGHPTRNPRINAALGFPPLGLWLPFARYRESHLAHHAGDGLTDPRRDPESFYVTSEAWSGMGPVRRALIQANNTFVGRVLIGPALSIVGFITAEAGALARGEWDAWRIWIPHAIGVAAVLAWTWGVCGIPPWSYLALYVYPGLSLTLIRSFAEHRAEAEVSHRTAIVENAPVLGLLFLNNNLHVVHHQRPGLPWYEIPAAYRRDRARLIAENENLVYRGYGDVARRHLLTTHHRPVHPLDTTG
ncbi:fatty acid desaturase [Skermanella stibiiresistens SB22]|uniref:Fatty acid desaturase n=1 Tax=Skermanella stibiiresistens SB22 TaxID=1385369 RepID=W9GTR1_9PROT|nr:fatty acid desaturase [Skermanella stibiiresistens]EWY35822.1 fatty acid desaturase [Skermanella stibiiresistens SB22]